ncbi:MAG: hypothetical protein JNM64_10010, partial [Chloroflexia bacterium]|nr:hypothetical protein [Chloroflexia bacterium]
MDDAQFDRLARALGAGLSRRGAARIAAALGFTHALGPWLTESQDAEAKRKRKNTRKKKKKKKPKKPRVTPPPGCVPKCEGRACGSDGCGTNSNCGRCTGNLVCIFGACTGPTPRCGGACCAS